MAYVNLVPRACDPREGTRGSGIIGFREESDWPLKWMRSSILATIPGFRQRIIPESVPEPRVPSRGSSLGRGYPVPYFQDSPDPCHFKIARNLSTGIVQCEITTECRVFPNFKFFYRVAKKYGEARKKKWRTFFIKLTFIGR